MIYEKKLINKSEKIFIAGATSMAGIFIKRTFFNQVYGAISYGRKLLAPKRREISLLNKNDVDEGIKKQS